MSLLALFALIALMLASVGIYGVMHYSVTQRVQEIGVRMALGARPVDVLQMIVRRGVLLGVSGLVVGLSGALCSRAEAHVLRLSMIYALLDKSNIIREKHLRAALEVWRYCEASVTYIFGNALGDFVADAIDRAMHDHGEMTRAEISRLFSHNKSAPEIERALALLEQAGRIRRKSMPKGKGRPIEIWEK